MSRAISCSVGGAFMRWLAWSWVAWSDTGDGVGRREGRKECIGLVDGHSVGHMHTYHCWCVGDDAGGMDKRGSTGKERIGWGRTWRGSVNVC